MSSRARPSLWKSPLPLRRLLNRPRPFLSNRNQRSLPPPLSPNQKSNRRLRRSRQRSRQSRQPLLRKRRQRRPRLVASFRRPCDCVSKQRHRLRRRRCHRRLSRVRRRARLSGNPNVRWQSLPRRRVAHLVRSLRVPELAVSRVPEVRQALVLRIQDRPVNGRRWVDRVPCRRHLYVRSSLASRRVQDNIRPVRVSHRKVSGPWVRVRQWVGVQPPRIVARWRVPRLRRHRRRRRQSRAQSRWLKA